MIHRNLMLLKIIFGRETKVRGQKNASFKNIKFLRGNYHNDSYETKTLFFLYCSPLNLLPVCQFKNLIQLFSITFLEESCESQIIIWKRKQTKTHSLQFVLFIFCKPTCLQEHFMEEYYSSGCYMINLI